MPSSSKPSRSSSSRHVSFADPPSRSSSSRSHRIQDDVRSFKPGELYSLSEANELVTCDSRKSSQYDSQSRRGTNTYNISARDSLDLDRTKRASGTNTQSSSSRRAESYGISARDSLDLDRTVRASGKSTQFSSSRALVPEGYDFDTRSRGSQSTRTSSSTYRPGFETRLARLENGSESGSRTSSSRTSSSSYRPGFETRLARLENGNDGSSRSRSTRTGSSSGPGNQTLMRKVDQLQEKMEDMKFNAYVKEVEAKNEKIKETESRLRRAEDRLDREGRKVTLLHLSNCTCSFCY